MKDKIKNIAEKLEHQIRMHELDLNDRIKDIPQIILLLEQGFSELKEIVSFYKFKSEMDEIFFFKIIKPKFFSKLINDTNLMIFNILGMEVPEKM